MKRISAIALALALFCALAVAEGAPFALENGATWGMSQGDVLGIESTSDVEYKSAANLELLDVDDVAFRGCEADLNYIFRNDALLAAIYELDPEDADPAALVAALDAEYGAHTEDKGTVYFNAMSDMTGTVYTVPPEVSGMAANWTLPDGTLAMLVTGFEPGEDDFIVVYVDAVGLRASASADVSEPAPALEE